MWRINWEHFNADLQDCNLEIFSKSNDVDAMISEWYAKVFTALDRHAPLQPPRKPRRRPCPWLCPELVSAVRQRNKAHRLLSRSPNDVRLREQHRTLRAAARKLDRRLRDQYFQARLQSAGKDGRKLWNTINVVTGRAKSSSPPQVPVGILSRTFGEVVHDPGRPDALCANAPAEREAPAFTEFAPVSTEDITALLQSVDASKATGHDDLPGIVLRNSASILAPSLSIIFNTSLCQGCVPRQFKIANVSPLFKGGGLDPCQPTAYRPISLLPVVSRLLEKIVKAQLTSFLTDHSILPDSQFAYRKNHSTEDALVLAVNRWLKAKYERKLTGVIFVDMSKAFDCVKHTILAQELSDIGVGGTVQIWFTSYLSERLQRVVVGGNCSEYVACSRGVPQGSVLGPLLFTLYIRNLRCCLPQQVTNQEFADDIAIEASGSCEQVCSSLSTAITGLSQWLEDRGLMLNQKKTQALLITPRGPAPDTDNIRIRCGNAALAVVEQARYLGVMVDGQLSWEPHVNHTIQQVRKSVGALWRSRRSLTLASKILFYRSMIQGRLSYASNAFYPSLQIGNMEPLTRLTKCAIRGFFGLPPWSRTSPIFEQLRLTTLEDMFNIKLLIFVRRCLFSRASSLFTSFFVRVTGDRTRGAAHHLVRVPFWPGPAGRATMQFIGAVLWNQLPPDLRSEPSHLQFCALLKAHHGSV